MVHALNAQNLKSLSWNHLKHSTQHKYINMHQVISEAKTMGYSP